MTKNEKYKWALKQIRAQVSRHTDVIAILANTSAILRQHLEFFWVGFYLYRQDQLILGPFQGTPACVNIQMGQGVCGTSAARREAILVPDVHAFPGHIACDPHSKSELVAPLLDADGNLRAVLDADSDQLAAFDAVDLEYFNQIAILLREIWTKN